MPGSTSSSPPASSGPRWPRSRRTTSGSPSSRSGWTPTAPATWTSRTAWRRRRLLIEDVNTIRATNNAIFNDIFWVHLAYVTADDGIERLRALLQAERHYARRPRRLRGDRPGTPCPGGRDGVRGGSAGGRRSHLGGQRPAPRARAARLGATQLRSPLVRVRQARLDRLGHELRGARRAAGGAAYFTSFYLYSLTEDPGTRCGARTWPRITRFDDRWRWLATSVVPRFQMFDSDQRLLEASIGHVLDVGRVYEAMPCIVPM